MMPGGGGGGAAPVPPSPGAGAGGAGAAVGADVLSDAAANAPSEEGEAVDVDPYGTPMNDASFPQSNVNAGGAEDQSEWATFEEPDHGFEDPFADDNAWSDDGDGWGGDAGDAGDGEGGGVIGTIMNIFNIFSDND